MSALIVHLWQSTWFAVAAWLMTLLVRKDSARIRFGLWLAASLKFLLPFAALAALGHQFLWQVDDERSLLTMVQEVAAPFTATTLDVSGLDEMVLRFMITAWAIVALALMLRLLGNWRHSHWLVRESSPSDIEADVPVRTSRHVSEPVVVGIVRPVILLPTDLLTRLAPSESQAVMAHELWHVRRRDNLGAMLHAVIEALFWFHPLVWWIGAQLMREREHACDEAVIDAGHERCTYASALLNVCRCSIGAANACVSSATGGELTMRIRSIMSGDHRRQGLLRRAVLATVLLACVALPIAGGMTVLVTSHIVIAAGKQSIRPSASSQPAVMVMRGDYVFGRNVSLRDLIVRAYAVSRSEVSSNAIGLDAPRYDIELRARPGSTADPRRLIAELLDRRFNVKLVTFPALEMEDRASPADSAVL
jgi:beta-lactamase regulating signal transducer with metallopeptidase domain